MDPTAPPPLDQNLPPNTPNPVSPPPLIPQAPQPWPPPPEPQPVHIDSAPPPVFGFNQGESHGSSKMKYFLYGFLLVLLMTAIGFGGYYLGVQKSESQAQVAEPLPQKTMTKISPTPTAAPTPTINPITADWKPYVSAPLAISFKYPEKYGTKNYPLEVYETNGQADTTALKADSEILISVPQTNRQIFGIYYYKSSLTATQWWQQEGVSRFNKLVTDYYNAQTPKPTGQPKLPVLTISASQVGGTQAIVAKGMIQTTRNGYTTATVVSSNGAVYMFYQENEGADTDEQKISDLILSTVQFGSAQSASGITTASSSATGSLTCGGATQTQCPTGYFCQTPTGSLSGAQGTCALRP